MRVFFVPGTAEVIVSIVLVNRDKVAEKQIAQIDTAAKANRPGMSTKKQAKQTKSLWSVQPHAF